jgi:hypothetical protein
MSILDKFLKKLGVASASELNSEEKETYREWENALSGRKLTDEEVQAFLAAELHDSVIKVTKQRLGDKDDMFLKMKIDFITACQKFLSTPAVEKQMTEAAITQMLKK